MSSGLLTALAAAAILAVVVLCVLLATALRAGRRLEDELVRSHAELADLEGRLDALARQVERPEPRPRREDTEFLITTAGHQVPEPRTVAEPVQHLTSREFASVAFGESLVTVLSLGYGVRRALSAENRNRIAFEMRREVRRARKERRRELRQHRRRMREPLERADEAA